MDQICKCGTTSLNTEIVMLIPENMGLTFTNENSNKSMRICTAQLPRKMQNFSLKNLGTGKISWTLKTWMNEWKWVGFKYLYIEMKHPNAIKSTYIKILTLTTVAVVVFHIFILLKLVPYDIAWGGNLKSDSEMYVFEILSLLVNAFFIFTLLQKGEFVKLYFSTKAVSVILWIFFGLFLLNTVGNVFAKTNFEKGFAVLTLVNSILLWKINKRTRD